MKIEMNMRRLFLSSWASLKIEMSCLVFKFFMLNLNVMLMLLSVSEFMINCS